MAKAHPGFGPTRARRRRRTLNGQVRRIVSIGVGATTLDSGDPNHLVFEIEFVENPPVSSPSAQSSASL